MPDKDPYFLVRALSVKVVCLLHGPYKMTGAVQVSHLGYGQSYQDINTAHCTGCADDGWLHFVIDEDDTATLTVEVEDFHEAMRATLQAEFGAAATVQHDDEDDNWNGDDSPYVPPQPDGRSVASLFGPRPKLGGANG